jgi:serine/threonine protein kinase
LEIGQKLNHPCLVRIVGSGTYREVPYLVMDFVSGETLASLLRRERLELPKVLHLLDLMCQGVEYAHAQGVMHRDLKPDNIMLMADGGVKVLDFGVARPSGDWASLTGTGQAIGTPAYMAPEQLLGNPGFSSDIYALGIILFMMVRGRLPFSGTEVMTEHLNTPAPPLESGCAWLDSLCASMLEKSQTRRVASVSSVLKILKDNA